MPARVGSQALTDFWEGAERTRANMRSEPIGQRDSAIRAILTARIVRIAKKSPHLN